MTTMTTQATAQQLRRRATIASSSSLLALLLAAVFVLLFASTANAACPFAGKAGEEGLLLSFGSLVRRERDGA